MHTPSWATRERGAINARTRRTVLASAGLHVILVLLLLLYQDAAPGAELLTEITWIEPAPETIVPSAREVSRPRLRDKLQLRAGVRQEHFKRDTRKAEVAPRPQTTRATQDRLNERLASLQNEATSRPAELPVLAASFTPQALSSLAPSAASPRKLARGEERPKPRPRALQRSAEPPLAPVTAQVPETQTAPAPARKTNSLAQRTLAGASLVGPVADRRLLQYMTPKYPEWAKREAVEASVRIYFVVLGGGAVKENVMVQKTSGYGDFDRNAADALLTWQFEPLPKDQSGEQWGEITFHYRLSGTEGD